MKPLTHRLAGELYQKDQFLALLLNPAAGPVYLRYALTTRGRQESIFPAMLLDDWGREQNTLALYRWIYDQGLRFPRAEVFGFEETGADTQVFLRALEIHDQLPLYVFPEYSSSTTAGCLVKHMFLTGSEGQEQPIAVNPPADIDEPLQRAKVRWWQVNSQTLPDFGFARFSF